MVLKECKICIYSEISIGHIFYDVFKADICDKAKDHYDQVQNYIKHTKRLHEYVSSLEEELQKYQNKFGEID